MLPGVPPRPGAGPGGDGGQIAGDPPRPGTDPGGPSTAGRGPRGVPPWPGSDAGGPSPARGRSRGSPHGQGQIPGEPPQRGADPGASLKPGTDPGGPSTAGAAARPGRGRKAGPPRVKPPPPAHLRSPKAPKGPPRSGAPCPAPEVPPVLTALRGGAAAEPPRRAAAAASASASRSGRGRRTYQGGRCLPARRTENSDGTSTRARGPGHRDPFHRDWDRHTYYTMHGSQVMQPPPSAQGPCSFKNGLFFLPRKCCHIHTEMLPAGERHFQL